jgi:hypothetical protein
MIPVTLIVAVLNPYLGLVAGAISTFFAHLRGEPVTRNILAAVTLLILLYVLALVLGYVPEDGEIAL